MVPTGQAGQGAAEAVADLLGVESQLLETDPRDRLLATLAVADRQAVVSVQSLDESPLGVFDGSSLGVGRVVAAVIADHPGLRRMYLDVAAVRWHDAGAGLCQALGARADVPLDAGLGGLEGAGEVVLPSSAGVAGCRITLLVPPAEATTHLTGLRGITVARGRRAGASLADQLATDRILEGFARCCWPVAEGVTATTPGAGSRGGLGFAVLALGGEVLTGDAACARLAGLSATLALADLVVVGCDELDFGSWDQTSVLPVAAAVDGRVPVVAVARRNHISNRELRTQAIEAAHSLVPGDLEVPGPDRISDLLAGLATTWIPGR